MTERNAEVVWGLVDHAARTDGNPYVCPLPDDVGPALGMALDAGGG